MLTRIRILPIMALLSLALAPLALAQVEPADKDFKSAIPLTVDLTTTAAGPTSPTGKGRPPRVGPNTRVNDPQQAFPNGLLGRSETTIAATVMRTLQTLAIAYCVERSSTRKSAVSCW